MISSALRTRPRRRGFSLVELIMAATLSGLVLAGVLSAFAFIVPTSQRAASYSGMEGEIRRGLEAFARDAREAVDLRWQDAQRLTLHLPDGATPQVVYAYDADAASPTHRCLYRQEIGGGGAGPREVLVRNLAPDFAFHRYRLGAEAGVAAPAANDLETKQIQVVLRAVVQQTGSGAPASQAAFSARFVLRNKRVSN